MMNLLLSLASQWMSKEARRSFLVSPRCSDSRISMSEMSRLKNSLSGRIRSFLFPESLKIFLKAKSTIGSMYLPACREVLFIAYKIKFTPQITSHCVILQAVIKKAARNFYDFLYRPYFSFETLAVLCLLAALRQAQGPLRDYHGSKISTKPARGGSASKESFSIKLHKEMLLIKCRMT